MTHFINFAAAKIVDTCDAGGFFGFPTWFKYLRGTIPDDPTSLDPRITGDACTPIIGGLSDVWLIAAAVLEILLRVAAFLAIGLVVYGGIRYIVSQGEPDQLNAAKSTIVNSLIGLVVSIVAAAVVSFIAGQFK